MHAIKLFTGLLCAASLSACLDVELQVDLNQQNAYRTVTVGPDIEKMGKSPNTTCESNGGSLTTHPDGGSTCESSATLLLDEWIKDGKASFYDTGSNKKDSSLPIGVKRTGDYSLKLTLDVKALIAMLAQGGILPPDMPVEMRAPMLEQMKIDAAGHSFKFIFSGDKVVNSNGVISDDRTSVTFEIPLVDVLEPNSKSSPDQFSATIEVSQTLTIADDCSESMGSFSRYVPKNICNKRQQAAAEKP